LLVESQKERMGKENKPARMNPTIKKALPEKSIAATGIQIDSSRPPR
jgi:hypothetical protein